MHGFGGILALNLQARQDGRVDVGTRGFGQRRVLVEVVIGVLSVQFDAVEVLVERNHLAVPVASARVPALGNAVVNVGEVDELPLHHGVWNGEVAAAFDRVGIQREQTVQRRTVFDDLINGLDGVFVRASFGGLCLAFFLGFFAALGVGFGSECCGHQAHAEQGDGRDGKLPHRGIK